MKYIISGSLILTFVLLCSCAFHHQQGLEKQVIIKYNQPVNDYHVEVQFFPHEDEYSYRAIISFQDSISTFHINVRDFYEEQIERNGSEFKDGESFTLDYIDNYKGDDYCWLDHSAPFFFCDVNFDGADELIIREWQHGTRGQSGYDAYELWDGKPHLLSEEPFNGLESYTVFNKEEHSVTLNGTSSAWEGIEHTYQRVPYQSLGYDSIETYYRWELTRGVIYKYEHNDYYERQNGKLVLVRRKKNEPH